MTLLEKKLDEDKAENIVTIQMAGKSDVADAIIIATGRSARHVGALASKLAETIKEKTGKSVAIEGTPVCDWVLLDAQDIIVHLFRPEVREFYNLERLWLDDDAEAARKKATQH